jgi:hypothetical protein
MMRRSRIFSWRLGTVLTLTLIVSGCTKSGQFDPTDMFNSDVFDSKKKLKGERVPVFPEGVPGATTGVPAELVKGYEPPPDQPEGTDTVVAGPKPPPSVTEADKPKPKPKPKPKVVAQPAAAPAPTAPPTRISVGSKASAGQQQDKAQSVWPAPPQQAAQSSQTVWPAPPQTAPAQPAQSSRSVWPDPPPPSSSR